MLLVAPDVALRVLDLQCRTTTGSALENLVEQIKFLTPRVAAALEVDSLERGTYRDTFQPPVGNYQPLYGFRLSRGFLLSTPTLVNASDVKRMIVNSEYGTIHHAGYSWDEEFPITVQYSAGFVAADVEGETYKLANNVPDWLQSVVIELLLEWRRNGFATPAIPKERGADALIELNQKIERDIRIRVYGRWMRPRHNLRWPVTSERI